MEEILKYLINKQVHLEVIVMAKIKSAFSEQIRFVIQNCGKTRYRLSKETGIHQSSLSRFVRGKCNLSLNQIDKLAEKIGFEIRIIDGGK